MDGMAGHWTEREGRARLKEVLERMGLREADRAVLEAGLLL